MYRRAGSKTVARGYVRLHAWEGEGLAARERVGGEGSPPLMDERVSAGRKGGREGGGRVGRKGGSDTCRTDGEGAKGGSRAAVSGRAVPVFPAQSALRTYSVRA